MFLKIIQLFTLGVLTLLLVPSIALGNTIQVNDNCTLVDAIQAANTDSATGGCPAGSGFDSLVLESNRIYKLSKVTAIMPANQVIPGGVGGPFYLSITSDLEIFGNGAHLVADFPANANSVGFSKEDIAVLLVAENTQVELANLTISGGTSLVRKTGAAPRTGHVKGAAITNFGQLKIQTIKLTGNRFKLPFIPNGNIAEPAALANYGEVKLVDSLITGNETTGIYTDDTAKTTILRSTISSNRFVAGVLNRGQTDIGNSTIAANMGSQIQLETGTMALHNDTIVGVISVENGTNIRLANTVVANNDNNACHFINDNTGIALVDIGHNWFQDDSCNGTAQGDPMLSVLTENGGFSQTIALLTNSPLIDAGNNVRCNTALVSATDQRLIVRPQGSACDIGAYELEVLPSGIEFQKSVEINHQFRFAVFLSANDIPELRNANILFGYGPATFRGSQPGVVRLQRSISFSIFPPDVSIDMRFQEFTYLDQFHVNETIDLMGFFPGVTILDDGTVIDAGSFSLSGNGNWQAVNFAQTFQTPPRVFLFAQTSQGGQPPVLSARNISSTGFEASLNEEEKLTPTGHLPEIIAYFAIYNPNGHGSIPINGKNVDFAIQQLAANHNWTTVFGKQIKLQEEQSRDQELFHVNELVDVMQLGDQIYVQSVSHNGGDPFTIRIR